MDQGTIRQLLDLQAEGQTKLLQNLIAQLQQNKKLDVDACMQLGLPVYDRTRGFKHFGPQPIVFGSANLAAGATTDFRLETLSVYTFLLGFRIQPVGTQGAFNYTDDFLLTLSGRDGTELFNDLHWAFFNTQGVDPSRAYVPVYYKLESVNDLTLSIRNIGTAAFGDPGPRFNVGLFMATPQRVERWFQGWTANQADLPTPSTRDNTGSL